MPCPALPTTIIKTSFLSPVLCCHHHHSHFIPSSITLDNRLYIALPLLSNRSPLLIMLRPPRTRSSVEATRPGPLRSVDKNADLTSKQQHLESFKPARKTNTAAARTGASVDELRRAGTGIRSRKTLAQLSPRTSSRILAKQVSEEARCFSQSHPVADPSLCC